MKAFSAVGKNFLQKLRPITRNYCRLYTSTVTEETMGKEGSMKKFRKIGEFRKSMKKVEIFGFNFR